MKSPALPEIVALTPTHLTRRDIVEALCSLAAVAPKPQAEAVASLLVLADGMFRRLNTSGNSDQTELMQQARRLLGNGS